MNAYTTMVEILAILLLTTIISLSSEAASFLMLISSQAEMSSVSLSSSTFQPQQNSNDISIQVTSPSNIHGIAGEVIRIEGSITNHATGSSTTLAAAA